MVNLNEKNLRKVVDYLVEVLGWYEGADDGFQKNLFAANIFSILITLELLELRKTGSTKATMEELSEAVVDNRKWKTFLKNLKSKDFFV